jgi:hypothetical protein
MLGSVRFKIAMPGETELGNAGTLAQQGISRSKGVPMVHWPLVGSHWPGENPPSLSAGVLVDEPAFYSAGYWVGEVGIFG